MPPLYLIRHGLTQSNIDGIVSGSRDEVVLIREGVLQSQKSGSWLKEKSVARIFASPMLRVRQTVEAMKLDVPVVFDERLREACYGVFEKTPSKDLPEEFRWKNLFVHKTLCRPEGESVADISRRLNSFIEEYLAKEKSVCAVVAHGGTLRVMLTLLCPTQEAQIVAHEHMGNADVWYVENAAYIKAFSPQ